MSGRTVLSDVGSSHTLEVKTTDVAHFESPKTTGSLVCVTACLLFLILVMLCHLVAELKGIDIKSKVQGWP